MFCGAQEKERTPEHSGEVKKIENYIYRLDEKVGEGNFSQVYHGVDSSTGKSVAIKVVKYSSLKSTVAQQLLKNQVNILKEINHPNVIRCLDIFSSKNNCYIITDFYEGGDLEKMLYSKKTFSEKEIQKIVYEVYQGLVYLNHKAIIHRDFKLANVFIDAYGTPKIADFGFAIKSPDPFKDINIGSPIYMSPEGMLLHEYGPKTEVWAFGILIYELLHGITPLSHCRTERELKEQIMLPPRFREDISINCRKFIDVCLTVDPKHRIDMKDLIKVPYLAQISQTYQRQKKINNTEKSKNKSMPAKQDLFSTYHSMATTVVSKPIAPHMHSNLRQLIRNTKNYDEAVSLLHYCRLIHKTAQGCSPPASGILSQWLLMIFSELKNIKVENCDFQKNEKLKDTLINYYDKYRKEHQLVQQPRESIGIQEVLLELDKEIKRVHEFEPKMGKKQFGFAPNTQSPKTKLSNLSVLFKETEILKKSVESQQSKISFYCKLSQAEHYLQSLKNPGKETQYGRFPFPTFPQ